MRSFKINFSPADGDELKGQSKWWGSADLPDGMDYPFIPYDDGDDDPMTFICQIRCADLAETDTDNLLPHEGMLYFFADIDEYVGAFHKENPFEYDDEKYYHNGMGPWSPEAFKVLYSPTDEDLNTHRIMRTDGEPYGLPAEKISFETCDPCSLDTRLLGFPFEEEIEQEFPDYINLLQLWEEDRWRFFMYDCGILNFLILPEDLKARRFDQVKVYLHSC